KGATARPPRARHSIGFNLSDSNLVIARSEATSNPEPPSRRKSGLLRCARNDEERAQLHIPAALTCPSGTSIVSLEGNRAQGMPGAGRTHGPPAEKKQAAVTTGSAGTTGIPRAMVLRLIARSPRRPGLIASVALRIITAGLDPSVGGPGPHAFAV